MSSIFRFISNLYWWIYYSYTLIKNWTKDFRNQIGYLFHFETWNHFFLLVIFYLLFVFIRWITRLLSLVVSRCHLLSLVVPLVVTRCHSMHHSLVFLWTIFQCCDVSAFHRCLLSRQRKHFPLNFLKVIQFLPLFLSYF